jgi:hypothetical protein
MNRMNRTEFFDKLSGLDEQHLKTALWCRPSGWRMMW